LSALVARWRIDGLPRWRALVAATLADLPPEETLVNFGAQLLTSALRLPMNVIPAERLLSAH
jgi:hypothetical protein